MDDCGVAGCLVGMVFDDCEVYDVVAVLAVWMGGRRRIGGGGVPITKLPDPFIDASG